MYKYLHSELNTLDQNGFSMGYCGVKTTVLTKPDDYFTEKLIGFTKPMISSNPIIAQDQLQKVHDKLQQILPYLDKPTFRDYAHLNTVGQINLQTAHFLRTRGFATLEERTTGDDISSVEQALGLNQVLFTNWDLYTSTKPNNHHTILAKEHRDSKKVLIIDPSYQLEHSNPFGEEHVVDADFFNNYFSRVQFKNMTADSFEQLKKGKEKREKNLSL